jgi:hypothetical protein
MIGAHVRPFAYDPAERSFYGVGVLFLRSAGVPVTAKLSKAFYDRLGEQIANELVEWFNQVDATYRNDLRELNELNFQRFGSRLDERVAASEAKFEVRMAELESTLGRELARLEATLERRLGEQTRWLFVAWASLLVPIVGLWIRG